VQIVTIAKDNQCIQRQACQYEVLGWQKHKLRFCGLHTDDGQNCGCMTKTIGLSTYILRTSHLETRQGRTNRTKKVGGSISLFGADDVGSLFKQI
jgi:hypothetical protein